MEAFSMNEFGEREKIEFYRYKTDTTEFWLAVFSTLHDNDNRSRALRNTAEFCTTNTTNLQWQIRKSKSLNKRKKFSTLLWKFLVTEKRVFRKRKFLSVCLPVCQSSSRATPTIKSRHLASARPFIPSLRRLPRPTRAASQSACS